MGKAERKDLTLLGLSHFPGLGEPDFRLLREKNKSVCVF